MGLTQGAAKPWICIQHFWNKSFGTRFRKLKVKKWGVMFQFVCLHFIYFFRDRVSQGWPQTFNSPASVSWVLQIDVHYHGQLFFRGKACVERAQTTCVPPTLSLVFWVDCRAATVIYLAGTCAEVPGLWNGTPQQLPICSHSHESRQIQLCVMASYCALAPDHSHWVMTKHPTPFWKWLHCHRTSLHHGTY